jgi:hypothetical protein
MLREFELGQRGTAEESLRQARAVFDKTHNQLQGNRPTGTGHMQGLNAEPYARDRAVAALIKNDSDRFWNSYVYETLLYWPPQTMAVILSRLSESAPLTGRLKTLSEVIRQGGAKTADIALRARIALWRPLPAAVLKKTADNAGGLDRCMALAAENKKEEALAACQEAVYSMSAAGGKPEPVSYLAACDASFESYKLLKALGRDEEAREMLLWAVKNAPPDWAALPEARKEFARIKR